MIRLDRRPGQKEQRYRLLLDEDDEAGASAGHRPRHPTTRHPAPAARDEPPANRLSARWQSYERELAELREQLGG